MQVASIHKAKTHLSDLIKRVEAGEDVIICKAGRPIVRVIKYDNSIITRKPGVLKGKIKIADDFDQLPLKPLSSFQGNTE